jgi:polyisoprenoid-binding protein YceI
LIPGIALAALLVLGAAGAYVYFFSGLRSSPASLALSSPTPSVTATSVAGTWQVASGSLAGYRVKEQFAGQPSSHEAVARTNDVTGQVTITQTGSSYQLTSGTVTVRLATLASVDQVAGYNVSNRDRIVQRSLDVSQYPTATFQADPASLPSGTNSGQDQSTMLTGRLTIHGVTRTVTASIQGRANGNTAQLAGSVPIVMTDYGVTPPSVPFTVVQPGAVLEFQLNLTKA